MIFSSPEIELGDGFAAFLERDLNKDLLRFTTAGSVDDGKSTLIGRLLHDSKGVYEDQLASVKKSRINRSGGAIDFSLLTDGLRAEREQGITIDVAYRYFSTSRRKFIIADTPGHEQYTRNMATGASTADLAVILVDATKGLLPQTRRHLYIASLLGIPNVLAAINKMDLAGYREDVFRNLEAGFIELAGRLGVPFVQCIPISALEGDNVVERSGRMGWYSGPTLLGHLETVEIPRAEQAESLRFPIQFVIRPDATFRGFAGRVASGEIRPGDAVVALPSGRQTVVESIVSYDGNLDRAGPAESVVLTLRDQIDLSRGDMLVAPDAPPQVSSRFSAMVVWLNAQPLVAGRTYLLKHAGRHVKAKAARIRYAVDVNTLAHQPCRRVEMNDIAAVEIETTSPLYFDSYDLNRTTGSFILIDPLSNATVGAGMIREDISQQNADAAWRDPLEVWSRNGNVTREERFRRHRHRSAVFSITGDLPFAELLDRSLFERGFETLIVKSEELPPDALRLFLPRLLSAGILVILWSDGNSPRGSASLASMIDDPVFEISPDGSDGFEEPLDRALAFAETLRTGESGRTGEIE
ncbi:MAG TPA: sulfate adenylyltransferase subunit CysN [Patescibacteria group bacterium]|nr:sulfate adenylyltransferase subunit CysN [Patescibacteria group bacterium]